MYGPVLRSEVSPAVTADGVARMLHLLENNRTWFDFYVRANTVGVAGGVSSTCETSCRQHHLCALANVDLDDFRMCVTTARALSTSAADETCGVGNVLGVVSLVVALRL